MKFLAVKDFALFQHYRDRNPPWIKLYGTLLSDAAFLQMPEAAQAQLIKLWILASQLGHPLPNNPKLLAGRIGSTGRFYLQTLIDAGFIIPRAEGASPVLAEKEHEASPSVRARGREESSEVEIEKALSVSPAVAEDEAGLAVMLASDSDRVALTAIVARARSRAACIASLRAMLTGNDPACGATTAEQFGQALRDFAANAADWNAAHFRGYVKRASAAPRSEEPSRPPSGANASTGHTGVRPEHWKDKNAREDREEAERQLVRMRHGNIEQRRTENDGDAWWRRMQREAKAAGVHPTLYGFDRLHEPATLSEAAHA